MKIFISTNCQSYGLVNCMSVLCPDANVSGAPFAQLKDDNQPTDPDIVFTAPEFRDKIEERFPKADVYAIPFVFFDRYHPDLTYVKAGAKNVFTPCDAYHSLIAFGGFMKGFSERETLALYNDEVFSALGYFVGWAEAQDQFVSAFRQEGIEIEADFVRWSRSGPFMHSFNHPQIRCLFDIAKRALDKAKTRRIDIPNCIVNDNLMAASIVPVFPSIALSLACEGSYIFKVHGSYKTISLEKFVHDSFLAYAEHDKRTLRVNDSMKPVYEQFSLIS
ncbi:MAG: WcbI family polysaccharide biosynthesis putative acetyltransferase [Parvularculaceae bacterium]